MQQVEIGRGKRALRAYSFDDIYLSPARRTRDADLVSTQWQIDAYTFEAPMMTAPADSVVSPQTAVALGRLGVMAVLPLEGLWTRHENPSQGLAQVARADTAAEQHQQCGADDLVAHDHPDGQLSFHEQCLAPLPLPARAIQRMPVVDSSACIGPANWLRYSSA